MAVTAQRWSLRFLFLIIIVGLTWGCASPPVRPRNVILYIGDGMGPAQRQLAEDVSGNPLVMNSMPILGMFTNSPALGKNAREYLKQMKLPESVLKGSFPITDSAASATALATGRKTESLVVGLGPEREVAYETLAEAAKRMGKSVGLISTTLITDATPAAFGAHVENRSMQDSVAEFYLDQGFDVYMGGGRQHFIPKSETGGKREDARDLIKDFEEKGYTIARTKQELMAIDIRADSKILALFSPDVMPFYLDRTDKEPDLSQMVDVALKLLRQNPKGFFLMVEGARIDHASHSHDPGGVVGDLLELDRAVETGLEEGPDGSSDTLVLVCADHETGGLSLGARGGHILRPGVIKGIKHSIGWLSYVLPTAPDKGLAMFTEYTGINDLSAEEIDRIKGAIVAVAGISDNPSKELYEKTGQLAGAITDIINNRVGLGWSSTGHTAMPITITASGPGAIEFTGYYDQTEVAKKIAGLWDVELGSWPVNPGDEEK